MALQGAVPATLRVIVTRPWAQAQTLVRELQSEGIDAVALPLIQIAPVHDLRPLRRAWRELPQAALAMFVSANAVQFFMAQRPAQRDWPAQTLAGSTGPGTSAALSAAGVPSDLLVEPTGGIFDSEALWQRLQRRDWQGRRVLVVRGEGGRDWLAERFGEAGAQVDFVAAYERQLPQLDGADQAVLDAARAQPRQHLWLFSSSEALANLGRLAPGADWSLACALAPHARIVSSAAQLGFGHVALAAANGPELVQAVRSHQSGSIQSGAP